MSSVLIGAVGLSVLIGTGILVLTMSDAASALVRRVRNPPAVLEARREAFEIRTRSPDWNLYEAHLERSVPQALTELFCSKYLSAPALYFNDMRLFLAPIDASALQENWIAPGMLPFAYSEADPIYLRPGAAASNAVFITYHDGNDTEQLSPTIEAFAATIRAAT